MGFDEASVTCVVAIAHCYRSSIFGSLTPFLLAYGLWGCDGEESLPSTIARACSTHSSIDSCSRGLRSLSFSFLQKPARIMPYARLAIPLPLNRMHGGLTSHRLRPVCGLSASC